MTCRSQDSVRRRGVEVLWVKSIIFQNLFKGDTTQCTMSKIDQLLDRASDKFMAADILANHECFDDAVSRTFYGLLYCARALLLTKSLSLQDPDEVISAFRKEFVKKGIVDSELGTLLKEIKPLAEKADYSPSFKISDEKIKQLMEGAQLFMEQVEDALSELEE